MSIVLLIVLSLIHAIHKGVDAAVESSNLGVWGLNLALGGVALIWMTPLYYGFYNLRIWPSLSDSWQFLALSVLVYDFLYYWFHRVSHRFRLLWNVHSVHHQTLRLTPSLGLRSSAFDFAVIWVILGLMFWLGFSSQMIVFSVATHGTYQLLLHNEWRIKFGLLEAIFNTPSHHRLHHAVNAEYLDKNFGSILIIWDRIFGTFTREGQAPKIGILGTNSWNNPIYSNLFPWIEKWLPLSMSNSSEGSFKEIYVVAPVIVLASLFHFHWEVSWVLGGVVFVLLIPYVLSYKNKKSGY